jgi:hypothetical protein
LNKDERDELDAAIKLFTTSRAHQQWKSCSTSVLNNGVLHSRLRQLLERVPDIERAALRDAYLTILDAAKNIMRTTFASTTPRLLLCLEGELEDVVPRPSDTAASRWKSHFTKTTDAANAADKTTDAAAKTTDAAAKTTDAAAKTTDAADKTTDYALLQPHLWISPDFADRYIKDCKPCCNTSRISPNQLVSSVDTRYADDASFGLTLLQPFDSRPECDFPRYRYCKQCTRAIPCNKCEKCQVCGTCERCLGCKCWRNHKHSKPKK